MVTPILNAQKTRMAALAQAWLAAGATAFGLWVNGRPYKSWPADVTWQPPQLVAPICMNGRPIAELRVMGLTGAEAQDRLNIDVDLLTELIFLSDELESMTSALIETQDQLLAFYNMAESMRNRLSIEDTFQSLTSEAARIVNAAGACAILVAHGEEHVLQYPRPQIEDRTLLALLREIEANDQRLYLSAGERPGLLPEHIKNLLLVPIRVNHAARAALGLMNKPGGFASPDLKMVRAICEQAGAQIENVLLHQENLAKAQLQTEMELAKQVQVGLLPQERPAIPGLDLYACSRPALQVGGDFYDLIWGNDRPFIFTIGDVSGKGMAAALLMVMMRTVIRAKAKFVPVPTPEVLMSRSNEDLYADFTEVGMFATTFVGQYNPQCQELMYANAGHSPVIYCPAGGKARLLEPDGVPIGILPDSLCSNHCLRFSPGDVLIATTDGFSEARNQSGEMFGYPRLLELVESVASQPAHEIADVLFEVVDRFSAGHPQDDDQTLMVLKAVAP